MLAGYPAVDVLIPTYNRPAALAVTMTSLCAQTYPNWRLIVSDQSEEIDLAEVGEIAAVRRVLEVHRVEMVIEKHLPRLGMAEQRHFLLSRAKAPYVLFLDDDLLLEPWVIANLVKTIRAEGCGFVGNSAIGLSYIDDIRPQQQEIEFWEGKVEPEIVEVGSREWYRYEVHNAANLYHVQRNYGLTPEKTRTYKVAWTAAGVLFDREKLEAVGGFDFWNQLPAEHSGEDVTAQLRVMAEYGGCGLLPSGIYHLELPTTIPNREIDAPKVLDLFKRRDDFSGMLGNLAQDGN